MSADGPVDEVNRAASGSLARRLAGGEVSSERAVERCIKRFESREKDVRAFAAFDAERALGEARARDSERERTGPRSALHGLPFAVKDVIDTVDLPTQRNSPRYEGRRAEQDAACVRLLRQAGCVLLGKAATVEFAGIGRDPPTTNPHDPERTPGGSSAGSGAAVATGMAPMALGTQTGGSVIRPASFCGVAGFKPTYGRVPVQGLWLHAPSLDTVGWMAEDVELLARTAEVLKLGEWWAPEAGRRLKVGLYRTPYWSDSRAGQPLRPWRAPPTRLAAAQPRRRGSRGNRGRGEPERMAGRDHARRGADFAAGRARRRARRACTPTSSRRSRSTAGSRPRAMAEAYDGIGGLRPVFDRRLAGYDAWLTASVPGEAIPRSEGNGEATFNRLFSALHLPCVTVPGLKGPAGLPVGVQFVGARFADMRVLAAAAVLEELLAGA